jgi:hypothetical protein
MAMGNAACFSCIKGQTICRELDPLEVSIIEHPVPRTFEINRKSKIHHVAWSKSRPQHWAQNPVSDGHCGTASFRMYANDRIAYSQLGYGTWQSAPGEVALGIFEALKVGYRHLVCLKPHASFANSH